MGLGGKKKKRNWKTNGDIMHAPWIETYWNLHHNYLQKGEQNNLDVLEASYFLRLSWEFERTFWKIIITPTHPRGEEKKYICGCKQLVPHQMSNESGMKLLNKPHLSKRQE